MLSSNRGKAYGFRTIGIMPSKKWQVRTTGMIGSGTSEIVSVLISYKKVIVLRNLLPTCDSRPRTNQDRIGHIKGQEIDLGNMYNV